MWYRQSKKYNIFGLPISGDMKFKYFADEDSEDESVEETPYEIPEEETETMTEPDIPEEITTDDPTPDDNFSPEDLQSNIEKIENDPTVLLALPPLHDRCRCEVQTLPILSSPGVRDGRRIWRRSEDCCEFCESSANEFNKLEVQRLMLKGIDINAIPS